SLITTDDIRNSKAYKEYYACATDVERIEAEQLKMVLKRSRQETHISQQRGSGTDKGSGSRPGTKGREDSEGDKTDQSDDGSDDGNDDDNDETVKAG
nr:hypothetical protein [Tanacetum cinerariifolium]